jgi:phospholipase C
MKTPSGDVWVTLQAVPLSYPCDFGHGYKAFIEEYDGGNMDGFGTVGGGQKCPGKAGTAPYQYVEPMEIQPYWDIAKQYVLADRMFQTQGSGSFTAHQDLIAGGTTINPSKTRTLVDFPTHKPWGCDAPRNTDTTVLVDVGSKIVRHYGKGPFPCLTYPTIRDLLDTAGVSWKYYSPPEPRGAGSVWNAFDAIKAVREGSEWQTNIALATSFFSDVANGALPSVAWIVPDRVNSDHPGSGSDFGPSWVASIVNAVGESAYWSSTAVVIVWDDWGGMYDHRAPPFVDAWGGLGLRVPMLVVSPYSRQSFAKDRGYVSHTQYEFASILRFIEDNWGLGRLGTTDLRAASIADCFNFTQPPRPFHPIRAPYGQRWLVHQSPSNEPVDDE